MTCKYQSHFLCDHVELEMKIFLDVFLLEVLVYLIKLDL